MTLQPEPDKSAPLWYGASRRRDAEAPATLPDDGARDGKNQEISVRVRLFGRLAGFADDGAVEVRIASGGGVRAVVAALGACCGPDFSAIVERTPGELARFCRVFVNGMQVDDLDTPLAADGKIAECEMILLLASEGG